jgi:hypothetical protein
VLTGISSMASPQHFVGQLEQSLTKATILPQTLHLKNFIIVYSPFFISVLIIFPYLDYLQTSCFDIF